MQPRKQLVLWNIHAIWPFSVWTVSHYYYTFSMRLLHFVFLIHNNKARSVSFFRFSIRSRFLFLLKYRYIGLNLVSSSQCIYYYLSAFVCLASILTGAYLFLKSFDQNILSFIVGSFEQQNRESNHWIYINSGRGT